MSKYHEIGAENSEENSTWVRKKEVRTLPFDVTGQIEIDPSSISPEYILGNELYVLSHSEIKSVGAEDVCKYVFKRPLDANQKLIIIVCGSVVSATTRYEAEPDEAEMIETLSIFERVSQVSPKKMVTQAFLAIFG